MVDSSFCHLYGDTGEENYITNAIVLSMDLVQNRSHLVILILTNMEW